MDRTLKAVELMLGRKLRKEELYLYHTTKNDDRYEYMVSSDGTLDTRFTEYPPVEHVIYQGETADMRGKTERR